MHLHSATLQQSKTKFPRFQNHNTRCRKVASDELEGNTINDYAYIVRTAKPVGTRDVTRGAELSSTSVAFRHLQKLEGMGLIEKNSYGNYVIKEKANINGHVFNFYGFGCFC